MLKKIIKLVFSLSFYSVNGLWRLMWSISGNDFPGTCVVLLYHAVTDDQRARFARQMDFLASRTKCITADFEGILEKGAHYTAVTFDDGFASVIKNALPEIIKRGIHTTLFIPSGLLGWYPTWCEEEPDFEDRFEIIMTPDQLRSVNNNLVSIGSHSRTHPNLLDLTEEEAFKEFQDSKEELESILDKRTSLFAFPGGWHNQALVELAKQAGYKRVFTVLPKLAFTGPNEFTTGRVSVSPDDWFLEFRLKVMGAYRWEPFAYTLKHKLLLNVKKASGILFKTKEEVIHDFEP